LLAFDQSSFVLRRAKGKVMVRASCECGVCANARIAEKLSAERAGRRVCLAAAAVERQQPCKVTESKSTARRRRRRAPFLCISHSRLVLLLGFNAAG